VTPYPTRINLDGSPTGEEVDDAARATAKARLEERVARRPKKAAREEKRDCGRRAEASAQPQAPEPVPTIPGQAPEPAAPPESKPRKLLVTGSAAMEAAPQLRLASGAVTTEILRTFPRRQRARDKSRKMRHAEFTIGAKFWFNEEW
jgi:sRNA-binding protein